MQGLTQRTQRDDTHTVEIFDNSMQVWIFSYHEKGVNAWKEIIVFGEDAGNGKPGLMLRRYQKNH